MRKIENIVERFKRYISIDTRSDEESKTVPTTKGQLDLGKVLKKELEEFNLSDVRMDGNGYIYATLKSNMEKKVKTIGFIAHMDTSPDAEGRCLNPQMITYKGGDIKLNDEYSIKEKEFPFIKDLVGKELITTDGTTLLGADDKAGIAAIMNAMEYLVNNKDVEHGDIKIAFTPDEEVGRGADFFDVKAFDADFAYTVDGGPVGELQYENFNAANINIEIQGKNVHPGTAKDIMVNSLRVALELENMLPVDQKPEYTEMYEGFFLLTDMKGTVDNTKMKYILRDHSMEEFTKKKELIQSVVDFLNEKYGNIIDIDIEDSYYNMKEKIEPHMEIVELAKKSMEDLGIEPIIKPIRGGTDGARLSYMGLPTPNIFTGGYNFHGRFEFIATESMILASKTILKIIENNNKE